MKKVTLFALVLSMTLGAFAQGFASFRPTKSVVNQAASKPAVTVLDAQVVKNANVKEQSITSATNLTFSEQTYEGGTYIMASYDATFEEDLLGNYVASILLDDATIAAVEAKSMVVEDYVMQILSYASQAGALGYCIDTIDAASKTVNVHYDIYDMITGGYGDFLPSTNYTVYAIPLILQGDQLAIGTLYEGPSAKSFAFGGTGLATAELTILETTCSKVTFDVNINDQTNYFAMILASSDVLTQEGINSAADVLDVSYKYTTSFEGAAFGDDDNTAKNALKPNTEYTLWAVPVNANEEIGTDAKEVFTTPSCDGEVGLTDVVESTISVYPNPTSDFVKISSLAPISNVEILNTLGQVVYSDNTVANGYNISVSNLEKGTYFVKVRTANSVNTSKVVVK